MGEKEPLISLEGKEVRTLAGNGAQIDSRGDFWGVGFDNDEMTFVKQVIKSKSKNLAMLYNNIHQFWLGNDKKMDNLDDINSEEYAYIIGRKNIDDRETILLKSIILKVIQDFYLNNKNMQVDERQSLESDREGGGNKNASSTNLSKGGKNMKPKFQRRNIGEGNNNEIEYLVKLLGGARNINKITADVIRKLKKDDLGREDVKQKINSSQFIEKIIDNLLGKKKYPFYSNEENISKIAHLREIVKNYLLNNLNKIFGSTL